MGKQHIQITQNFNAPIETIFNCLTDHETFGQVISTKIKRIRVQNLPDHENVQTSDTVLNHVKRFERNNSTGVDDSNSNVTDGRTDLKKYPVYNRVP